MARRPRTANNDDEPRGKKLDQIIQGLINRLPQSGDEWAMADRKVWLDMMESAFNVIYEEPTPKTPPAPKPPGTP